MDNISISTQGSVIDSRTVQKTRVLAWKYQINKQNKGKSSQVEFLTKAPPTIPRPNPATSCCYCQLGPNIDQGARSTPYIRWLHPSSKYTKVYNRTAQSTVIMDNSFNGAGGGGKGGGAGWYSFYRSQDRDRSALNTTSFTLS
ncbi:uncharacterized protein TrAFT101_002613 [Trichoderma asperellum]|uniref:uncharacterized protein n=1 Tax=Trichoderma asperellum TaxID=101201 RepID=UPI00331A1806|nr:hypothetical protein TrAFT101_002613 [Trichoderma asperellum]